MLAIPTNQACCKWESRGSERAQPAQDMSAGGWLLRCEEMHSRQGPGQAVRQLLGLGAFWFLLCLFFSSYLGLAGVGGCGGACILAPDKFGFVFPWFSAV